jgi:hypothetical protein
MTNSELISLFAFMITVITTLAGWIFTYRSQRKTQQTIAKLEEQMQDMMGPMPKDDAPKYSDSSMLLLSADEIKDLSLWYSKAKAWHLKNKGNAVDWENKHLREEVAAPIRLKLADAKTELDIMRAFDLRNAKLASDGEV